MDNDLNERLGKIEIEDNFFVLFIFLIVLAFIANNYEKDYFMYKEDDDRKKYYYLQIFIFSMVVIVNVYYENFNHRKKLGYIDIALAKIVLVRLSHLEFNTPVVVVILHPKLHIVGDRYCFDKVAFLKQVSDFSFNFFVSHSFSSF